MTKLRWALLITGLCMGAVVCFQVNPMGMDHANANICTLIFGFVGLMAPLVWFTFSSGFRPAVRFAPLGGLLALVAVLAGLLRIDHVSGELVPVFAWRWSPRPDVLLEAPPVAEKELEVDLLTRTEQDFPQFLGPERNAAVEGIELVGDWTERPPELVWRQPIGAGWSAFSAVNGYAVTLEQRGEEEWVSCYEVASGRLLWWHGLPVRHSTQLGGVGPRSTPTIAGGNVYALGATGVLRCLQGDNGRLLWSQDLPARYGMTPEQESSAIRWGRSASPLVLDDLVVVPAGGPPQGRKVSLVAFDRESGQVVWEGGQRQISYSSPNLVTLGGMQQILIVNEDSVSGHDPSDGRELWWHPWPGKSNAHASVSQAVVLPDDHVMLSKGYGGGALLLRVRQAADGQWSAAQQWDRAKLVLKTKFTNVTRLDEYLYGLSDGILECVQWQTGQRQWKRGRYGHGQLLRIGSTLLVQAETGELVLVEATPQEHRQRASFPALEGKTWNNPCLYGPYLLVRNGEQAACYRVEIRPGSQAAHQDTEEVRR